MRERVTLLHGDCLALLPIPAAIGAVAGDDIGTMTHEKETP